MKSIKKRYAETWQENETSIVLKMLGQSVKENDQGRVQELERYLLDLERKSDGSECNGRNSAPSSAELEAVSELVLTKSGQKSKSVSSAQIPFPLALGRQDSSSSGETSLTESASFSPVEVEYLKKAIRQNTKQYDMQINIMIVGDTLTGKTSLMRALLGDSHPSKTKPTVGLDSRSMTATVGEKTVRYKIIDSDGEKSKEFIRKGTAHEHHPSHSILRHVPGRDHSVRRHQDGELRKRRLLAPVDPSAGSARARYLSRRNSHR